MKFFLRDWSLGFSGVAGSHEVEGESEGRRRRRGEVFLGGRGEGPVVCLSSFVLWVGDGGAPTTCCQISLFLEDLCTG